MERTQISAGLFWMTFRDALAQYVGQHRYTCNSEWTCVASHAAEDAIQRMGLAAARERHVVGLDKRQRLDVAGFRHDGTLAVAYEHENDDWTYELQKLNRVSAALRVLGLYHDYIASPSILPELEQEVSRIVCATEGSPQSEWLFIVGPRTMGRAGQEWLDQPFEVFSMGANGALRPLRSDTPFTLRPCISANREANVGNNPGRT